MLILNNLNKLILKIRLNKIKQMQLVHNKFKVHKSDPINLCMTDILVYAKNVVIQMHGDFPSNFRPVRKVFAQTSEEESD